MGDDEVHLHGLIEVRRLQQIAAVLRVDEGVDGLRFTTVGKELAVDLELTASCISDIFFRDVQMQ